MRHVSQFSPILGEIKRREEEEEEEEEEQGVWNGEGGSQGGEEEG